MNTYWERKINRSSIPGPVLLENLKIKVRCEDFAPFLKGNQEFPEWKIDREDELKGKKEPGQEAAVLSDSDSDGRKFLAHRMDRDFSKNNRHR